MMVTRMNLRFSIEYHTRWGQELRVVGSSPELGEWSVDQAPRMTYSTGGMWSLSIELPAESAFAVRYKYCLLHGSSASVEWEAGRDRELPADVAGSATVDVVDSWRPTADAERVLQSAAFTRAVLGGKRDRPPPPTPPPSDGAGLRCRFRVTATRVEPGLVLCVVGSHKELGSWSETEPILMSGHTYPHWEADVELPCGDGPVRYKYAMYDPVAGRIREWETGEDRILWLDAVRPRAQHVVLRTDHAFRHGQGPWRGAGIAVPVFSLRSHHGLGVGEFADIKPLADWAVATGLKMIQLLPVNDTVATHTWVDSYPYAAVSVFALHPIYMSLEDMGVLGADTARAFIEPHRRRLNALAEVDYEAVMAVKSRFFKLSYDAGRDAFLRDPGFVDFFETHRAWLVPYAVFSCLRDRFGTSDYTQWPTHRDVTAEELEAFASPQSPDYDDVAVHYFIQYHLHRQLLDAANYARRHGVALKGDIPIGVYRHSVDTWIDRRSFHLDCQAGAPPDDFAVDGQNWGFPTYNWEVMAQDGFAWWRRRLTHLATYFDAFRIDHILGFFRIWEIPFEHVQGIMGHFNPAFSISIAELGARGMWFDRERLCAPYIRRHMLGPIFGEDADHVAGAYLEEYHPGCFRLKPEFDTQRKVERTLAADSQANPSHADRNGRVLWGLYRVISEVIFLDAGNGDGTQFYPRHSMHSTYSYRELDSDAQWRLNELYIDYFYKRHEDFWRREALVRLPAVRNATDMLICGEDLGMVPDCVPGVMEELGILSLFIQRMPKNPKQQFSHPADCPHLSVCSPSTHDMSTLRGWWGEDRTRTQRFYNLILGKWGDAPTTCEPWVIREILVQHLFSPSAWAVFPLQDLLALDAVFQRDRPEDERINIPSNPRHYWRYRMHLSLDQLNHATAFNSMLREVITWSGRNTKA